MQGLPRTIYFHPGHEGAEVKRRCDIVGNVELTNFFKAGQAAIHALQDGLAVFLGEGEPGDLERAFDHFIGDRGRLGFLLSSLLGIGLHFGPKCAGQKTRTESDAGKICEKSPPIFAGIVCHRRDYSGYHAADGLAHLTEQAGRAESDGDESGDDGEGGPDGGELRIGRGREFRRRRR